MNELPVIESVDIDSLPPLMVHIEEDPPGSKLALCGYRCLGIYRHGEPIDCIVCADISNSRGWK